MAMPTIPIVSRERRNKTKKITIKHYTHHVFFFTAVSIAEHPRNSADVFLTFLAKDKHLLGNETEPSE